MSDHITVLMPGTLAALFVHQPASESRGFQGIVCIADFSDEALLLAKDKFCQLLAYLRLLQKRVQLKSN